MRLAAWVALLALSLQEGPVELRLRFEKGRQFRYRHAATLSASTPLGKREQSVGYVFRMTVREIDAAGEATLDTRVEGVSVRSKGDLEEAEFDSEKDKDPEVPLHRALFRMVGQAFVVRMTPASRIVDVKGFDPIIEVMSKVVEEKEAREAFARSLKTAYSDESVKATLQQVFPPLPAAKVKKGEEWTSKYSLTKPAVGTLHYTVKSRAGEVKGGETTLEQAVAVEWDLNKEGQEALGATKYKDHKGKATCRFSLEKGCYASCTSVMTATMIAFEQEMPVTMKTELELLEVK